MGKLKQTQTNKIYTKFFILQLLLQIKMMSKQGENFQLVEDKYQIGTYLGPIHRHRTK